MATSSRTSGTADSRCPTCGTPVIRQLVGHRAALEAVADTRPLTGPPPRDPNRLTWHLITNPWTGPRLTWINHSTHPADCTLPHHPDHRCPTQTALDL